MNSTLKPIDSTDVFPEILKQVKELAVSEILCNRVFQNYLNVGFVKKKNDVPGLYMYFVILVRDPDLNRL